MDRVGDNEDEMWDEEDGFFYDLLRLPDGGATRLKVRSMVGLLPLCATTVLPEEFVTRYPNAVDQARRFLQRNAELAKTIRSASQAGGEGATSVRDSR